MNEKIGFRVCMPFSECPNIPSRIKDKCIVCGGAVGYNGECQFAELPEGISLQCLCGACAVDMAEGDKSVFKESRIPINLLTEEQRAFSELLASEGGKRMLALLREHKDEFKADSPREEGAN